MCTSRVKVFLTTFLYFPLEPGHMTALLRARLSTTHQVGNSFVLTTRHFRSQDIGVLVLRDGQPLTTICQSIMQRLWSVWHENRCVHDGQTFDFAEIYETSRTNYDSAHEEHRPRNNHRIMLEQAGIRAPTFLLHARLRARTYTHTAYAPSQEHTPHTDTHLGTHVLVRPRQIASVHLPEHDPHPILIDLFRNRFVPKHLRSL